ncbi:DUF3551 domain-containing protein [Bradyrhizobium sp. WD16]|uniref:DUF3551 domain-containing protein n=1 Tax=Bradyrhizobium sp. WD16 TaxID=1521768 RepID=UPI0020A5CB42|nr:DUF3551 domain-containing protein [Bradyrhizobium sp. WD16]UTD28642.1 hypothetical protein DB459_18795 [Bradyrhizobium sp. WD16]
MMRAFALTAVLAASSAVITPATAAPPITWCARTSVNGWADDCMYYTYGQCRAAISGLRGECVRNPFAYYGEAPRRYRRPHRHYYPY